MLHQLLTYDMVEDLMMGCGAGNGTFLFGEFSYVLDAVEHV